jgi:hypothetical protein
MQIGNRFDGFGIRSMTVSAIEATPAGLTSVEAKRRLDLYGPNSLERNRVSVFG